MICCGPSQARSRVVPTRQTFTPNGGRLRVGALSRSQRAGAMASSISVRAAHQTVVRIVTPTSPFVLVRRSRDRPDAPRWDRFLSRSSKLQGKLICTARSILTPGFSMDNEILRELRTAVAPRVVDLRAEFEAQLRAVAR